MNFADLDKTVKGIGRLVATVLVIAVFLLASCGLNIYFLVTR